MDIEVSSEDYKALEAIRKRHQSKINLIFVVNPDKALESLAKSHDLMTIRTMVYIMSRANIINNEVIAKVNLSEIKRFIQCVTINKAMTDSLNMSLFKLANDYNAIRVTDDVAQKITTCVIESTLRQSIINRITK